MSFYVTIPSTASSDVFPDNKSTDFKVRLPSEISFNGDYEVALSEIIFKQEWLATIFSIKLTLHPDILIFYKKEEAELLSKSEIILNFEKKDGELINKNNIDDYVKKFSNYLLAGVSYLEYIRRKYKKHILPQSERVESKLNDQFDDNEDEPGENNKKLENFLDEHQFDKDQINILNKFKKFTYVRFDREKWFICVPGWFSIFLMEQELKDDEFSRNINIYAHVNRTEEELLNMQSRKQNIESFILPLDSTEQIVQTILVYSDIITNQYLGDKKVPFLREIAVSKKDFGDVVCKTFGNGHFLDVNFTTISTIHIQLRNVINEKIKFISNSQVSVKLNFRPKKYF